MFTGRKRKRTTLNYSKRRKKSNYTMPRQVVPRPEVKFLHFISGSTAPNTGTVTDLLTSITQGTTQNRRIGNQIHVLGFKYQVTFAGTETASLWYQACRFTVFKTTSALTAPDSDDIYDQFGTGINKTHCPLQLNNGRGIIDRVVNLSGDQNVGGTLSSCGVGQSQTLRGYKKLNFLSYYNNTGEAQPGLLACGISDNAAGTNPVYQYWMTVYFIDL